MSSTQRPEFRNIHISEIRNYRLPLAGFVSILHRISGLLMFVLIPFVLYLLDASLRSPGTYEYLQQFAGIPFIKLLILVLSWAYLHHLCAGIRHLMLDLHIGIDKDSARQSSVVVFLISIPLAALIGLKLFGVF